ncbi:MAG: prolyl oligopeptidase family serine peptidase [Dysgonamonadaceae bacterium]|jgi:dienelactone hydrolase|nr:prolyl oligopeptidase family serine peptidase [Dysgonamonadaceae bacterium]
MQKEKKFFTLLITVLCFNISLSAKTPKLWDVGRLLRNPPKTESGATIEKSGCTIQEVFYEGEPYHGKPTKVFAYLAIPKGVVPTKKFPAVLLLHGGGGKAFSDWAELWGNRGYVALAMDLAGCDADGKPHEQAGPGQDDETKFRDFDINNPGGVRDMWTYQAVAAVLRGHSLLVARKDVDSKRIAETGISWGGYLSCILATVDTKLVASVPVYGCGFIHESSVWTGEVPVFGKMTESQCTKWVSLFDPSSYLDKTKCPMLMINSPTDFAYHIDSYQKSYNLAKSHNKQVSLSLIVGLPHYHNWEIKEVEAFIDAYCLKTKPLATVGVPKINGSEMQATFTADVLIKEAALCYTTDTNVPPQCQWQSIPAQLNGNSVSAGIPAERPIRCFLQVTDERGLKTSSTYIDITDFIR